jgi:hypothetical protein
MGCGSNPSTPREVECSLRSKRLLSHHIVDSSDLGNSLQTSL